MKRCNTITPNKGFTKLLPTLVSIFLTTAAQVSLAQNKCANVLIHATASYKELYADHLGFHNTDELNNKAGLFEIVFEYEKDGKIYREMGFSKGIYQQHISIFKTDGKMISLQHGKNGVIFQRLMYRGGLDRVESNTTPLPIEMMKKENEGKIFAFHIQSSKLKLDLTVIGKMKILPEGYEFSGAGDIYVIDPALIQKLGRGQVEMFSPPQDGKLPFFKVDGISNRIILAEHDGRERINTFLKGLDRGEVYSPDFFDWFKDKTEKTKRLISRLFPTHNPPLLISRVTHELGESFLPLFLHPEIAKRWGEALEFAKELKNKNSKISNYEVFKAFEEKQGTLRLYRGLVLTEDEFSEIQTKGLLPPGLRKSRSANAWMLNFYNEYSEDPALLEHIHDGKFNRNDDIGREENGLSSYGLIQSFTMEPEIAKSVPYWLVAEAQFPHPTNEVLPDNQQLKPGYNLYVFEVEVPKWSVSYAKDYYWPGWVLSIKGKEWLMKHDPRFEQYIPLALPKESIKSVEKITEIPPKFAKFNLKPTIRPEAH